MTDCNITNEVTEYIRESMSKVLSQESIEQLYEKYFVYRWQMNVTAEF